MAERTAKAAAAAVGASVAAGAPRAAGAAGAKPDKDAGSGAAAIARVADHVLPALIARLTQSDLGELEVAQHGWRVRLRRDLGQAAPAAAPVSRTGRSGAAISSSSAANTGTSGSAQPSAAGGQVSNTANRSSVVRRAATSPAVGYFTARDGLSKGQARPGLRTRV